MHTRRRAHPSIPFCRISGPGELLQAVPYLLGFHPTDSLVLVGLHEGRLVVTARLDLADAGVPGAVAHALEAMARGGTSAVLAAVYSGSPARSGPMPLHLPSLFRDAEEAGCDLLDVLTVVRDRWWSLLCGEPGCCPAEGRKLPAEPSPFAAAATYDGVVALPDRAALEAVLDPAPQEARAGLLPAIEAAARAERAAAAEGNTQRFERSVKRALFAAARDAQVPGWTGPDDATTARFGVALTGDRLRDAVWLAVDDGRLDGRPLWRELGRRLPEPYDAAPLFLFGWAAWRSGDGTLAGMAAERAVASDPRYSAADLLLAALSRGVDPRRLPKLRLPRSA